MCAAALQLPFASRRGGAGAAGADAMLVPNAGFDMDLDGAQLIINPNGAVNPEDLQVWGVDGAWGRSVDDADQAPSPRVFVSIRDGDVYLGLGIGFVPTVLC